MPRENDTTVRSNEWTKARRELLRWICRNEVRRRTVMNLTDAEIASLDPIVSVSLDASDTLDVLETLIASIESAESAESAEPAESAARSICPQTADPSLLTV